MISETDPTSENLAGTLWFRLWKTCTNYGNVQFFHISFVYIIYSCKEGVKFEVAPVQTKSHF